MVPFAVCWKTSSNDRYGISMLFSITCWRASLTRVWYLSPTLRRIISTKQVEIPQRLFFCLKKIQAIHKPIFSSLHVITCDFESFVFLLALTLDDCTCFHFPFEGELRFNKKNFMIFAYYFWNTHIELATILQVLDY